MALKTKPRLVEQVATPQTQVPLVARDTRAQAVHRLQIGLFGLAAMLLLVGLANIIMDRAKLADDQDAASAVLPTPEKKSGSDPLADIGVVPAADPSAAGTGAGKR